MKVNNRTVVTPWQFKPAEGKTFIGTGGPKPKTVITLQLHFDVNIKAMFSIHSNFKHQSGVQGLSAFYDTHTGYTFE